MIFRWLARSSSLSISHCLSLTRSQSLSCSFNSNFKHAEISQTRYQTCWRFLTTISRVRARLQHIVIIYYVEVERNAYFSFQCLRILALDTLKDVNFVGHYLSISLSYAVWLDGRSQHEIIIKCDIFTQAKIKIACSGFVRISFSVKFLPAKHLLKWIKFM